MTDASTTPPAAGEVASLDSGTAQFIVALVTVIVLGLLGGGLIFVGWQTGKADDIALGVIVGALANSLAPPSGIAKVIAQARKPG